MSDMELAHKFKNGLYIFGPSAGVHHVQAIEAQNAQLMEALSELYDLMQGVIDGDYTPDSFTLQVARAAILDCGGVIPEDDEDED